MFRVRFSRIRTEDEKRRTKRGLGELMVDSSDHMRDHKCDYDDERYSEQPKNDWHCYLL